MIKKKTNSITIDDLAAMVSRGFSRMEERMDMMSDNITEIKSNLENMDQRLVRIETNHERRLDVVESRVITLKNTLENQTKEVIVW